MKLIYKILIGLAIIITISSIIITIWMLLNGYICPDYMMEGSWKGASCK